MSARFNLDRKELRKWAKNTLVFLAPAILIVLLQIQDGKSLKEASIILYAWALNTSIDMVKKFIAHN